MAAKLVLLHLTGDAGPAEGEIDDASDEVDEISGIEGLNTPEVEECHISDDKAQCRPDHRVTDGFAGCCTDIDAVPHKR